MRDGAFQQRLPDYEVIHISVNGGPASKGYQCIHQWLANRTWDTITYNFGLHSLDNPPTSESETLSNYTREMKVIGAAIKANTHHAIWVDTTPVPLNVTVGPERHNRDVLRFNHAANEVAEGLGIAHCSAYNTIMSNCTNTTGTLAV